MGPAELREWEHVLSSQLAVALLLLAGLFVISGSLLAACRTLWQDNRRLAAEKDQLHQVIREHLSAQTDFESAVSNVRSLLALHTPDHVSTPGDPQ